MARTQRRDPSRPAERVYTTDLPADSPVTTDLRKKSWLIVLRCYDCRGRFTVRRIALDRIALVPQVTRCPHCDAQPVLVDEGVSGLHAKVHRILDLIEEENPD